MRDCEDSKMSPEEIQALESRLENSLQNTLRTIVKEEFRDIKSIITELFNKDIEYLKSQQETFKGYHQNHYDFKDKITDDLNKATERLQKEFGNELKSVNEKLDKIQDDQMISAAESKTEEKIEEKQMKKTEMNWMHITGIIALSTALGALIRHFIP